MRPPFISAAPSAKASSSSRWVIQSAVRGF